MSWSNPDILSQPLRLRWNGWESNTYELQNNGWELSANQDIRSNRMAIAIRHKQLNVRGLSDFVDFNFFRRYDSYNAIKYPVFGCQLASDLIIQIPNNVETYTQEFNPIDARPMYRKTESRHLDNFAHFRKIERVENEIYLEPASMDDILNMALDRQAPRQEEIRKEMVRRQELNVMRSSQLKAHLRVVV